MFGGKKRETEIFTKAYVEKANLSNVQVHPAPKDLSEWIEVDFDPDFNYVGKTYNVLTGTFVEDKKQKTDLALNRRKKEYKERSDPLFMEWQYDQTPQTKAAWRNEIAAIKAEFPKN